MVRGSSSVLIEEKSAISNLFEEANIHANRIILSLPDFYLQTAMRNI
jgi:hypothetical protein